MQNIAFYPGYPIHFIPDEANTDPGTTERAHQAASPALTPRRPDPTFNLAELQNQDRPPSRSRERQLRHVIFVGEGILGKEPKENNNRTQAGGGAAAYNSADQAARTTNGASGAKRSRPDPYLTPLIRMSPQQQEHAISPLAALGRKNQVDRMGSLKEFEDFFTSIGLTETDAETVENIIEDVKNKERKVAESLVEILEYDAQLFEEAIAEAKGSSCCCSSSVLPRRSGIENSSCFHVYSAVNIQVDKETHENSIRDLQLVKLAHHDSEEFRSLCNKAIIALRVAIQAQGNLRTMACTVNL